MLFDHVAFTIGRNGVYEAVLIDGDIGESRRLPVKQLGDLFGRKKDILDRFHQGLRGLIASEVPQKLPCLAELDQAVEAAFTHDIDVAAAVHRHRCV